MITRRNLMLGAIAVAATPAAPVFRGLVLDDPWPLNANRLVKPDEVYGQMLLDLARCMGRSAAVAQDRVIKAALHLDPAISLFAEECQ
jgi:hypothetical protein